jgi:hypothetical protein
MRQERRVHMFWGEKNLMKQVIALAFAGSSYFVTFS